MPCMDPPWVQEQEAEDAEQMARLRKALERAGRAACEALKTLTTQQRARLSPETRTWWEEHQAEDRDREQRERAKKAHADQKAAALAKLTPADRRALGLR